MIRCDEVTKIFRKNGSEVTSLDRFTAEIAEGEFVAVRGPSGSGKTTLLLTLGGMQRPSAGTVQLGGRDLYALSPSERAKLNEPWVAMFPDEATRPTRHTLPGSAAAASKVQCSFTAIIE